MNRSIAYIVAFLACLPLLGQQSSSLVGLLPGPAQESSGLIFFNGRLLTHNDSGNESILMELDTASVQIVRTVKIANATNTDWEDIAQDDTHIYIGDIGNNSGNRSELQVYKISKASYLSSDTVDAELISFTYEDQEDPIPGPNSDWDAEALLVFEDELFIFTKQWQSKGTKVYALPKIAGTHVARLRGSYNVNGLITGAVYNNSSQVAYLSGYTQFLQPFLLRLEAFNTGNPFEGGVARFTLDLGLAQVEGITNYSVMGYYLSTESFQNNSPPIMLDASLYKFNTGDAPPVGPPPGGEPPPTGDPDPPDGSGLPDLLIYNSIGTRLLDYELNREEAIYGRAIFDVQGRRVLFTHSKDFQGTTIDLSSLGSAIYYLTFYLQGKTISKSFFLK